MAEDLLGVSGLPREAREVHDFWFGELDENGLASAERRQSWWRKDDAFDAEIRERFGRIWERAAAGELDGWSGSPAGALALVLALDQFPRNMFREDAKAFSTDGYARRVCLDGIDARRDADLVSDRGAFFYLPLMHSERRSDQHLGIRMFAELVERSPAGAREAIDDNLDFMRRHFEIVDRFGRFPHRNRVLGRESTPAELDFLKQPGSSF